MTVNFECPRHDTIAALTPSALSRGELPMRTGAEYLRSLKDGRRVFVDGERVKDVITHSAFSGAAR
jgi:hypothetical protein